MLAIYATAALILLASLVFGRAIACLLGWRRSAWFAGAIGFAALVTVAPFLVRLPGRATTATIVLGLLMVAAAAVVWRQHDRGRPDQLVAAAAVAIVLVAGALPFLFNDRIGVLGEGIYTNDHAAQLYWADWLQRGFGPEPSAVQFGYPIGPQAVAVVAAEATGTSLVSSFNGMLLAIPALTALAALSVLNGFGRGRRIAIAALTGLTYLGASFLAQSAFKETAMALFVLAFALLLEARSRGAVEASGADPEPPPPPWRAAFIAAVILAAASVLTFSIPGLVWFALAVPLWLVLEALAGRSPIEWGKVGASLSRHRIALAVAALILIAAAVALVGPASSFVSKINDVQSSAGRLSSPVFPGEALGIWPAGDYRIVRGEVSGSLLATALGAIAIGYGLLALVRRRALALLAMLIAGGIVYVGARLFAQIHVEAKALMVIAPLVLLVSLRGLLAPPADGRQARDRATIARYALGGLVAVAAGLSTMLALRSAPVGFDDRQLALERLASEAEGKPLIFLGVDRFAGYYARDALTRAPAGYVPEEIEARPEKTWLQGIAADFDTVDSGKLDKFDYAIATAAAFASTPPPNFEQVDSLGDYVLWRRTGPTPRSRVLDEAGDPGATLDCASTSGRKLSRRRGTATVLAEPEIFSYADWRAPVPAEPAAGGQERGFEAPGTASAELSLEPGRYDLSLQYQSQVALEVLFEGERVAELPPSLDGMYLSAAGRGAFWSAGTIEAPAAGSSVVEVRAAEPTGLQDALGVPRRVWLGDLAASPVGEPATESMADACGDYVDSFRLDRRGKG